MSELNEVYRDYERAGEVSQAIAEGRVKPVPERKRALIAHDVFQMETMRSRFKADEDNAALAGYQLTLGMLLRDLELMD